MVNCIKNNSQDVDLNAENFFPIFWKRIHEHFFCVPNRTDMWLTPEPHYTRTVWHLRRHMCLLWNVASVKNPAALQVPGCSCLLLALKSTSETIFYLEMTSTSVHLRPYEPQTTPRHGNQGACMFGFVKYWIKGSTAVARNHPSGPLLSKSPPALYFVFKRRVRQRSRHVTEPGWKESISFMAVKEKAEERL